MAKLEYEFNIKTNKEEVLKDFKEIKQEAEKLIRETEYTLNKITLKRKDVLVIRVDMLLKEEDKRAIEERLKKKLHRKVLVLDNFVKDIGVIAK